LEMTSNEYAKSKAASFAIVTPTTRLEDRMRPSQSAPPSSLHGASMSGLMVIDTLAGWPIRTTSSARPGLSFSILSRALSTATFVCEVIYRLCELQLPLLRQLL